MHLSREIIDSAEHIRGINVLIWISVMMVHILHKFAFQIMRDETLIGTWASRGSHAAVSTDRLPHMFMSEQFEAI
jgi:hypothetical protein